mgnify:CR=1 FL=1
MTLPHIVIIHDDWNEKSPIVVHLKEKYGSDNVKFLKQSQQGIDYVMEAPMRKTIVLLDYNFKSGEPTGGEVFRKIREKSSLIYVIIVTKNQNKDINTDDFVEFINNNALAIARPSDGYSEITDLVEKAQHQLDVRADIIIEEWIASKPENERNTPYMTLSNGKVYSLNDMVDNIRNQTELGKEIERDILSLAIKLIMEKLSPDNA